MAIATPPTGAPVQPWSAALDRFKTAHRKQGEASFFWYETHFQNIAVKVLRPEEVNIAAFKPVTASSVEKNGTEPEGAADNDPKSRWASASSDPQWIMIDLEAEYSLKKIVVNWQNAAAKEYVIEPSCDGAIWNKVASVTDGKPGLRTFDLTGQRGRYLRLTGTKRTTGYGYSLFEMEAYGTPSR